MARRPQLPCRGDTRSLKTCRHVPKAEPSGCHNHAGQVLAPPIPEPEKRELRFWNEQQVGRFLKATKTDRLYPLYVVALASGAREGELFGLEWSDVDFAAGTIAIHRTVEDIAGTVRVKPPKTKKSRRRIDLPQAAMDALQDHRKAMLAEGHVSGPVFCDRDGGYLRRQNVLRRSFSKIMKAINEEEEAKAAEQGGGPTSCQ